MRLINNYVLHPSNCIAYEMVYGKTPTMQVGAEQHAFTAEGYEQERALFAERLKLCEPRWQAQLIAAYANPVLAKMTPSHVG